MRNKNAYLKYALITTGREIDTNEKHFSDTASALQKITPSDAEIIKETQAALLLYFPRLDQDSIDRLTLWAIGLSSVLGIDLQSAALCVSRGMSLGPTIQPQSVGKIFQSK